MKLELNEEPTIGIIAISICLFLIALAFLIFGK